MKVKQVFIKPNTEFSLHIAHWAISNGVECLGVSFEDNFEENIDGLVVFNENQDIEIEILEIRKSFDDRQKPVQRIDINGTLMVGVTGFSLWLDRNACESILMIGSDQLCQNPNLERYLSHIKIN